MKKWVRHIARKANVVITFPQQVEEEESTTQQGGKQVIMKSQHSSGYYQLTALSLPEKYADEQKLKIVEAMANSFISNNQAKKQSEEAFEKRGQLGKTYTILKKGNVKIKYRIFATDKMLYQLVMSTTDATYHEQNEQQFFGTFRLLY